MYKEFGLVKENEDLKKYNTYGIGGKAKYLVMPKSVDSLIKLLEKLKQEYTSYYVIGNGSNIILPDEDYNGVIIVLKKINDESVNNDIITVSSGTMLPFLANKLLSNGYNSFAWAIGIPGTIGGSIYGNAGAFKKDIFDDLIEINVLKDSKVKTLKKEDIIYSYRSTNIDGIILNAKFKIYYDSSYEDIINVQKKRLHTQPINEKCAGSVFRNPDGFAAGKLIDDLGLKGYRIGGAKISEKHANFIINDGNATSKDIINLINYIKDKVHDNYNIDLILEQKIVKWD